MKKFEYQLYQATPSFFGGLDEEAITRQLNQLGQQGWEVVAVVNTVYLGKGGLLYTLRRELAG